MRSMGPADAGDARTGSPGWRRLSPWALVFIVASGLQRFVRENLYMFAGAGAGFAFIDWLGLRELVLFAVLVLLAAVLASLIYHRRFRFRLEADAVRVRSGLFQQSELRLRFARVMNVHLSQPFYFRPLGLVRFALETPGAAQSEVELPGISRAFAEEMRERILAMRDARGAIDGPARDGADCDRAAPAPSSETVGGETLYSARARDVVLHGLVSNQLWLVVGALFPVLGLFENFLDRLDAVDPEGIGRHLPEQLWLTLLLVLAGAFIIVAVVSMVVSGVRFAGFTLLREGQRLRTRAGLLDRREQAVPVAKLHAFDYVSTAIGRLLGRGYLIGRQAALADWEQPGRKSRFLVPGLSTHTGPPLLEVLASTRGVPPPLADVSPLFRRVWSWRLALLLVAVAFGLMLATGGSGWLFFVAGVPLVVALVHLRWRRWGWAFEHGQFRVRQGLFGYRLTVFEFERVQHVALRRSPLQRRRGLADLVLTLPHGPVSVPFLPFETAAALANRCVAGVETAAVHRV